MLGRSATRRSRREGSDDCQAQSGSRMDLAADPTGPSPHGLLDTLRAPTGRETHLEVFNCLFGICVAYGATSCV